MILWIDGGASRLAAAICYGAAEFGSILVPHRHGHSFTRFAVIATLAAALGLAACGRKGPLDPPPVAAAAQPTADVRPAGERPESSGEASIGADGRPIAARGQQKRIFLDWLLD